MRDERTGELNDRSGKRGMPGNTGKPENTGMPGSTGRPENTGVPGSTGKPENTGMPGNTGKPENTGVPGNSVNSGNEVPGRKRRIEKKMFLCLILGVSLAMCLNLFFTSIRIDKYFPTYSTEVQPWLFRLPLWGGLVLYGLVAPVIEELIFRWLFFRKLCVYFIAQAAGAGSAIIFGLYHGNAVQFLYAFFFGLILAYVYWRFENLFSSIMVHGAANAYVYLMYFLPVSFLYESFGTSVLLILISGLVSFIIMMYFLNTSPGRSVLPEKPIFMVGR